MNNIARLGAVLALNTVEFVKGLAIADEKSKDFKKNLYETKKTVEGIKSALTVASGAFIAFAGYAAKTADEMSDLADANDTTIGTILEMKSALTASGGEAANVGKMFSSFGNAVNEATEGANDKMRKMFQEIGVSRKELANATADELRGKALEGLAKIEEQTKRNAIGMQLFGKAAKGVDFRTLGDNAAKVAGHYKDQEKAIREAAAAVQKLEMFMKDVMIATIMAIKPITELVNKLPSETRVETLAKAFTYLGEAIAIAFGVAAVRGVAKFATALRVLYVTNPWLLAFSVAGGAAAYGISKYLEGQVEDDAAAGNKSEGGAGRNLKQTSEEKKAADIAAKYAAETKEVERLYQSKDYALKVETQDQLNLIDLESKRYLMSQNQYNLEMLKAKYFEENNKMYQNVLKETADAQKQLELADKDEQAEAIKLYNLKNAKIAELYENEVTAHKKLYYAREQALQDEIARQQSWTAGWNEAFKEYTEAANRASDRGKAAFQSVMSNMETALRTFVETGKFAFKDLVGSIIKDLAYMELRAQASALLKMLFSSFGDMFGPGVIGRASGGGINGPTLVGENGPELFVPNTAGTVIPNGSWQQMAAAGSGGSGITVNGNYIANMSAIDTQSATQFLAKNKNAIWASYQSANRSVPISR